MSLRTAGNDRRIAKYAQRQEQARSEVTEFRKRKSASSGEALTGSALSSILNKWGNDRETPHKICALAHFAAIPLNILKYLPDAQIEDISAGRAVIIQYLPEEKQNKILGAIVSGDLDKHEVLEIGCTLAFRKKRTPIDVLIGHRNLGVEEVMRLKSNRVDSR